MLHEGGVTPADRLTFGHRLVLARPPRPTELAILNEGLQAHLARYRDEPEAAARLLALETTVPTRDASELAAYTAIASLLLNLDEAITNE
jgi:hypothetical protein